MEEGLWKEIRKIRIVWRKVVRTINYSFQEASYFYSIDLLFNGFPFCIPFWN